MYDALLSAFKTTNINISILGRIITKTIQIINSSTERTNAALANRGQTLICAHKP